MKNAPSHQNNIKKPAPNGVAKAAGVKAVGQPAKAWQACTSRNEGKSRLSNGENENSIMANNGNEMSSA